RSAPRSTYGDCPNRSALTRFRSVHLSCAVRRPRRRPARSRSRRPRASWCGSTRHLSCRARRAGSPRGGPGLGPARPAVPLLAVARSLSFSVDLGGRPGGRPGSTDQDQLLAPVAVAVKEKVAPWQALAEAAVIFMVRFSTTLPPPATTSLRPVRS